jgi:Fur family ferric uptake transcriptional regulator
VTALELEEELRRRRVRVGRASVYRALEVLEELRLVQRFEAARGIASYERVDPSGHHHHHAICWRCGRMEPFEDRTLERAIGQVAEQVPFEIAEHDVVLRGLCERCAS